MDSMGINNYTSYASSIASSASADELTQKAKSAKNDDELMEACKEFENYLWEQVIKSMKSTVNITGDSNSGAAQTVDYFMDTAISDVAGELTDQNMGPGSLAKQMYDQMKRYNTIDVETLLAQSAAASGLTLDEEEA